MPTMQLCEHLLKAVNECLLQHHTGRYLATSASIGLVTPEQVSASASTDALLMPADTALYAAKHQGGSRVEVYLEERD